MGIFAKFKKRSKKAKKKMEQYQEAIAFAEAEEQEQAQQFLGDPFPAETAQTRLLVIGQGSDFSKEIMDYALEMATRLDYQEIIALNTAPIDLQSLQTLDGEQKKLQKEFQTMCRQNMLKFREAAQKAGIALTHVIKFKDTEEALAELKQERPGIEFVISDLAETGNKLRTGDNTRPCDRICVYAIV